MPTTEYVTSTGNAQSVSATTPLPVQVTAAGGVSWTAFHAPGAAAQATIARAAGAAGVKHVCTSITATLACGATAQTPINAYLRDGTTGAGTILWAAAAAAIVNGSFVVALSGLQIVGTAATAMTLEFSAAGVAASVEAVTMTGYDTT